jgi:hypothetical protein
VKPDFLEASEEGDGFVNLLIFRSKLCQLKFAANFTFPRGYFHLVWLADLGTGFVQTRSVRRRKMDQSFTSL